MSGWQQAGFLVLGALISSLVGFGLGEYRHRQERLEERRGRQRQALLELTGPLLRLLAELSRQLEQGPDTIGAHWVGNTREIRAAGTWIFDDRGVANTLDWEESRQLAQAVERAWSDHAKLAVFDPAILGPVEEVRRLARAVGYLGPDIPVTSTNLSRALQELLAAINTELRRI